MATALHRLPLAPAHFFRPARSMVTAKILRNTLVFLLLLSGCAPRQQDLPEVPKLPESPPAPIATKPAETLADRPASVATPVATTIDPEEIRSLQARLRAAGVYTGPIDGIAGPKTRSGILRLQAACENLKDLLETSNSEIFEVSAESQAKPDSESIRLIQVRLKDAGFDPGPIDGRSGAKTRAAFLRFQAGCTTLKNLPPAWNQELRTEDKSPPAPVQSTRIEIASSVAAGNPDIRQ
jgi:hypothetical protein